MSLFEAKSWMHQTKENWLEQVRKENPGKDISDFQKQIAPGILNEPFSFYTDAHAEGNILLTGSHPGNWKTGIRLQSTELHAMKRDLDYALENGVEYIHFYIPGYYGEKELDHLLKNVHLDFIHSRWTLDPDGFSKEALVHYLQARCSFETTYIALTDQQAQDAPSYVQVVDMPCFEIESWIHKLSNWIHKTELSSTSSGSWWISLKLSHDFLVNIASLRALKAVLQKLNRLFQWNIQFKLEATIDDTLLSSDSHQNVIQICTVSLSGILAGVDFICFESPEASLADPNPKWIRTAVHMGHIMKQESYLKGHTDPLAGSYFLENLTEQIAQHIWNGLQNHTHR